MNIKGLLGTQIAPSIRPTEKVDRTIRSDITHDRDANGQQAWDDGQGSQHREPMSDEQLKKAMEHLAQLPVVRENKWTVQLQTAADGSRSVVLKDNLGTLIRRIPESELWSLPLESPEPKGHLFKRTA